MHDAKRQDGAKRTHCLLLRCDCSPMRKLLCLGSGMYLPSVTNLRSRHYLMLRVMQHSHELVVFEASISIAIEESEQVSGLLRRHLCAHAVDLAGDRNASACE